MECLAFSAKEDEECETCMAEPKKPMQCEGEGVGISISYVNQGVD